VREEEDKERAREKENSVENKEKQTGV